MKIEWPPTAQQDLRNIATYNRRDDPAAAARIVRQIRTRVGQLARLPRTGRPISVIESGIKTSEVREVIVPPYRVVYQLDESRVRVLAVFILLSDSRHWKIAHDPCLHGAIENPRPLPYRARDLNTELKSSEPHHESWDCRAA